MMRALCWRAALILLLGVSSDLLFAAEVEDLTSALTPEQVGCNEDQLERLLIRSQLTTTGLHTLFLTYAERGYEGLGVARSHPEITPVAESYLAFHLNPDVRPHLLNPERPPIRQVGLTREDSASNLGGSPAMTLDVNPLAQVAAPPWTGPAILRINNRVQPELQTSDVKPGRGVEQHGLHTVCHSGFTAFDRWVFSLLERMLVVTANTFVGPAVTVQAHTEVAIFRDQDPHSFRIHVYPSSAELSPDANRLAVRLRIDWTVDGRLTQGLMEVLPRCTRSVREDCTTALRVEEVRVFLAAPVAGGSRSRPLPMFGVVYNTALGNPDAPPQGTVDFEELLAATAWNVGGHSR
jgi:hypothetical protein